MKTLLIIIILMLIGALGYIVYDKVLYAPPTSNIVVVNTTTTEPIVCTADAKLCPDGSYVSRSGPACEFTTCPVTQPGENKIKWALVIDNAQAKSFVYTDKLATKYMHILDTPAKITISKTPFICNLAGNEGSMIAQGKTDKHTVGRNEYCVTTQSEGAAGSTYNTYNYSVASNGGTVTFNFADQLTQCANYNDPEKKECEAERAIFSIDTFVDQIFTRFHWDAFGLE